MGVQIELPLSRAEVAALLTHCNSTPASYLSSSSASSSSSNGSGVKASYSIAQGAAGGIIDPLDNEERAARRSHGEILYQYQRKQFQLHQERISEAQMQQAYYSLSTTPQDTYSSQVGGSYEDLGCSAAHSLCVPDEQPPHSPMERVRERGREVASPSTFQQQQMQLLEIQLLQKQIEQQKQQQHIKDEYAATQRGDRAPSSSSSSSSSSPHFAAQSTSQGQGQWAAQRHLMPSTVSVDSVNDRDHRSDGSSSSGPPTSVKTYEPHPQHHPHPQPQQDMLNLRSISQDGNGNNISKMKKSSQAGSSSSGSNSNNNSSNDDEKGPTWYEKISKTSSV